ncbi:MAG: hypothetical protein GF418_02310 [Chitinivibrionales bacterium]|nr:hypothetical protein [Chitinivibrionales bacterium]MBD3394434.1 hypothetical protein [Chitinivibrionales bacterium]
MVLSNVLVAQGGGPTSVINGSLAATIREFKKHAGDKIGRVYVALHGASGILTETMVDATDLSDAALDGLSQTVCAAAGSSREKLDSEQKRNRAIDVLDAHDVHILQLIGGGDTASTVAEINKSAGRRRYDLICQHILKTVDNDGYGLFSPGWGTAGRWVHDGTLSLIKEVDAMPGIQLLLSMGRDSGWITAMSTHAFLAEGTDKRGIQRIYTPETGFTLERFGDECLETFGKYGKLIVNVSEGVQEDGCPVSLTERLVEEVSNNTAALSALMGDQRVVHLCRQLAGEFSKLDKTDPRSKLTYDSLNRLINDYAGVEAAGVQRDQHGQVAYGEIRTVNLTDWLAGYLQSTLTDKLGRKIRVRGNALYYTARCPVYISKLDLLGAELVGRKAAADAIAHMGDGGSVSGTYGASVVLAGDTIGPDITAESVPLEKMTDLSTGRGIQYQMPADYMTNDGPTDAFLKFSRPLITCDSVAADPAKFVDFTDGSHPAVESKLEK